MEQDFVSEIFQFNRRTDVNKVEFLTDVPQKQSDEVLQHINKIQQLAQGFIREDGHIALSKVGIVIQVGVPITAGEKDSFGWLTGVIHTKHGKIVFG